MKEKVEAVSDFESFALSQEPAAVAGETCEYCHKSVGSRFTPAELAEFKLSGMCPASDRKIFGQGD